MMARVCYWMTERDGPCVLSEQQERAAEHHFSKLRALYTSGQVGVYDYIVGSARLAQTSMVQLQEKKEQTYTSAAGWDCFKWAGWEAMDIRKADTLAIKMAAVLLSRCSGAPERRTRTLVFVFF